MASKFFLAYARHMQYFMFSNMIYKFISGIDLIQVWKKKK